jgi:PAP2 superfamily protein
MNSRRTLVRRSAIAIFVLSVASMLPSLGAARAEQPADGSVIRNWNALALNSVKQARVSDAQAARTYAMVNVAMYDAVNGLASPPERRTPALVPPANSGAGDPGAAAATAAHDVLAALYPAPQYPALASSYDQQRDQDLAAVTAPGQAQHGTEWGAHVAAEVLAARANDGSSPVESQPGGTGIGVFRASWSGVQFRNLRPFAIADASRYVTAGPPALESAAYAAAFNEVKQVGNGAVSDPSALATYNFWAMGTGTSQPPGAWLQITTTLAATQSLGLADSARLFALTSMALADTVAPAYGTKFIYRSWRPATAIREADADPNPDTIGDTTWTPRAPNTIGTSPEHFSGHSSFSSAAATVLAGFFCRDLPFSMTSDSVPGEIRTYSGLAQAAAEAGRSRVVGGIHFEFSNQDGLAVGRNVAAEVLSRSLLHTGGPTHNGTCPL